ncbi:N-acetylglucosamine kinase-like BadF-type ATPase [Planomicrobium soli]|uniref:N-acetylglucosamine kinase-like BadF-type ATPase n=1 Tax=Planomicrobium soli TaxID=1176648 RepID=A0A2P8H5Z1_9BACL|nr:BadF/BadG/BcrA/BcrD ATPase family protein [Planomicrobium soli]PSL41623.1 N-acetylglucosamine kinase-like BadF-type ATPase [Planomicrobium soli]
MYVLGIDGGGTRTSGIVADEKGNIYMQAATGRSNPNTLSQRGFEQVMKDLLLGLKQQNEEIYNQVAICFAGIAGVDESQRTSEVAELLRGYLPEETMLIVQNDAINALYSGTIGEAGIVQISGTGAITYGINEQQKEVRAGGWGFLFDEAGSGFAVGKAALRAVFKEYDQRGPATSLTGRLLEHFQVDKATEIISLVYGQEYARAVIAPLAPLVVEEAAASDHVAQDILVGACEEMLRSINTCHRQLFRPDHPTTIVLAGGVFSDWPLFSSIFKDLTKGELPNAVFRPTQIAPVAGAVVAGLKAQGITPEATFVRRINEQIEQEVNV